MEKLIKTQEAYNKVQPMFDKSWTKELKLVRENVNPVFIKELQERINENLKAKTEDKLGVIEFIKVKRILHNLKNGVSIGSQLMIDRTNKLLTGIKE